MGDHKINRLLLKMSTPSARYKAGILNIDGEENSKRGGSSDLKSGSSGGESDHWVSGVEGDGELVNDGRVDEWHGSSKLKKPSHEVGDEPFSV